MIHGPQQQELVHCRDMNENTKADGPLIHTVTCKPLRAWSRKVTGEKQ